jgi:hypothetical protein
VCLGHDHDRGDGEHHHQEREGHAFEHVHQVVAEESHRDLQQHDDQEADLRVPAQQRVQRERAADAVDREPADAGDDRIEPGRQDVAEVAETDPGQHHLGHAGQRPAGGERAHRQRAEGGAKHDRKGGHPERLAEEPDADDADEDGRELHVRRHPRPELLQRLAVPVAKRDELGSARLHRSYLGTVGALTYLSLDERGRRMIGFGHLRSTPY